MKVRRPLQKLSTRGKTNYIKSVSSSRDEESSINLPGTREQIDGNLLVMFGYTIELSPGKKQSIACDNKSRGRGGATVV